MTEEHADYQQITYEVEEEILTVTLDRPERLNAFTATMVRELLDAFDRADADDGIRAVIVTGRGRAFCAGADLSAGATTFEQAGGAGGQLTERDRDGGGRVALRVFESTKPVIAAVNGPAVGVGATMTLPMDVRVAAATARFGFVFTRRGIVPEACSSWFLPRVVGISQAVEWVFSGRIFDAAEALGGGLVSKVVEPDALVAASRGVARAMTEETSAVSVALARRLMWSMLGAAHPMEAHLADSRGMLAMGRSEDAREGVASFLEKRPARFTMRVSRDMPDLLPRYEAPELS